MDKRTAFFFFVGYFPENPTPAANNNPGTGASSDIGIFSVQL